MGRAPTFCFGRGVDARSGRIAGLLRPAVEGLGYELVGVECLAGRRALVRVYIDTVGDAPAGVTLDDCERVSHQVSGVLDVEDPIAGGYDLEVSSPGSDRPLFTVEHYERFRGRTARVTLEAPVDGRRRFTGVLAGVRGDVLVLEVDGEEFLLSIDSIGSARLVPDAG